MRRAIDLTDNRQSRRKRKTRVPRAKGERNKWIVSNVKTCPVAVGFHHKQSMEVRRHDPRGDRSIALVSVTSLGVGSHHASRTKHTKRCGGTIRSNPRGARSVGFLVRASRRSVRSHHHHHRHEQSTGSERERCAGMIPHRNRRTVLIPVRVGGATLQSR